MVIGIVVLATGLIRSVAPTGGNGVGATTTDELTDGEAAPLRRRAAPQLDRLEQPQLPNAVHRSDRVGGGPRSVACW